MKFLYIILILMTLIFVYYKYNQKLVDHFEFKKHTTFVTAFYSMPNKYNKNTKENVYTEWITNLLGYARNISLVVFSTGEDMIKLQKIAKDLENIYFIDLPINKFKTYEYLSQLKKQIEIDPEKDIHSVELYLIWNEKANFIKRAIELNIFNSSHYCWLDIGYIRDPRLSSILLTEFPRETALECLQNINKICFIGININNLSKFNKKDSFNISIINKTPHKENCITGGFIFGEKEKLKLYEKRYYKLFDTYIKHGVFVGKDQNLMANIVVNFSKDFIIFDPNEIKIWLNKYQNNNWFSGINLLTGLEESRNEHTPHLQAGLGNQIFQVASIYGIARAKNEIFVLNSKLCKKSCHTSLNYIDTIFKRFLLSDQENNGKKYIEKESHFYDSQLTEPNSKYSQYIGFFQNYKYFDLYLDEIRKLLNLPIVPYTNRFFIHIRLGDYVNNKNHYLDLTKYYKTCIDLILNAFWQNIEWCIFTNDNDLAKEYLSRELPMIKNYTFGNSDELIALSEMSHCTLGGICANSTFSWWGAILNSNKNKKIFFPSQNYPENSIYYKYDIKGLFHPDFMIVNTK